MGSSGEAYNEQMFPTMKSVRKAARLTVGCNLSLTLPLEGREGTAQREKRQS